MGRALVLNGSFEPLGVVSARRAVVLVLSGRAESVHEAGDVLRSEQLVVDVPSVVRLCYVVKVPFRRKVTLSRRAVMQRDEHRCQYCGVRADSIDHVVPRSRGGRHQWDNVVAACRPCNTAKGDRLLSETSMALRRVPRAPQRPIWLLPSSGAVPDSWRSYLGDAAVPA